MFTNYHDGHRKDTRNYCHTRLVLDAQLSNLVKLIDTVLAELNENF